MVRRIENSEPIIFDQRQGDDELEDEGIRVIYFYIGDDDDDDDEPECQEVGEIDVSVDEPMKENGDVAIIIDSGADVALFPLSMADHGEGELQFSAKTKLQGAQGNRIPTGGGKSVEIPMRDLDGRDVLLKEHVIFSSKVNQPILCYGRLMEHGWGINSREQMLDNGDLKVPERQEFNGRKWTIDYGGKVGSKNSKKHFRVSHRQKGVRTIFRVNHKR